jgi:integrase
LRHVWGITALILRRLGSAVRNALDHHAEEHVGREWPVPRLRLRGVHGRRGGPGALVRQRLVPGSRGPTRDEYRRSFELQVRPFGVARQRLRDVTSRDVSDWFTELEQEGVKPPSIRKAKAALSAMLATAAQAGDIHGNPALGVRFVPSHAQLKRTRRTLTIEDVDAILSKLDPQWRLFFELLAQSGCRVGELLGLTWTRVHLGDDRHLYITEQVYKGKRKRLKTEGSERAIPLSPGHGAGADGLEGRDHLRGPG